MSKQEKDSDGFQIVSSKRSAKNKQTKVPYKASHFIKEENEINVEKSYQRVLSAVKDLEGSQFYNDVLKAVSTFLNERNISEIVCFGLGHVGECNISRYQLAFLLCLKDSFKPLKVLVHDPIFYIGECELLKRLGLIVIEENNEGSYVISNTNITVVYLPHCPKQLTNNFLWSNWDIRLENCILLCNSFTSLLENHPSRMLSEMVPYIYKLSKYLDEVILDNSFQYKDIFNDTSIHYIKKGELSKVDSNFWNKPEKPKYDDMEEFITTEMIEKLNI
ncbi:PREDICTED: SRR1-like protein [Papilio xuthus]|uniref:SRR1-like protein n=1 Tax=Papilio xuthus TaxID=66420 RepID=A0AAJ6Z5Z9_PAPXU|nr:PREDICTED: SRR1-like protein [Papilio xuthus]